MDNFGKGALSSPFDLRDFWYSPLAKGGSIWDEGYDIETVIGQPLPTKDQGSSFSCGGQAWSYYASVLEKLATGTFEERSAHHIYGTTHAVPGGGSSGRANCDFVTKGVAKEVDAPSYIKGKPMTEAQYTVPPTLSPAAEEDAAVSRSLSYLQVKPTFDLVAQAITDNYGAIIMIWGEDNGTWRSSFPQAPALRNWAHWLYCGKLKTINGKRYIGVKNSWGDTTGDHGWQWIGEEFFTRGAIAEAWTMQWDATSWKRVPVMKQTIGILQKVVSLYQQLLKK